MTGDGVERRLAAIMSADVAGYSRMMGKDEAGTLAALKAARIRFLLSLSPPIHRSKGNRARVEAPDRVQVKGFPGRCAAMPPRLPAR